MFASDVSSHRLPSRLVSIWGYSPETPSRSILLRGGLLHVRRDPDAHRSPSRIYTVIARVFLPAIHVGAAAAAASRRPTASGASASRDVTRTPLRHVLR